MVTKKYLFTFSTTENSKCKLDDLDIEEIRLLISEHLQLFPHTIYNEDNDTVNQIKLSIKQIKHT